MYSYGHQNPIKYIDPDGNAVFLPALYVAATSDALYLQTLGASVDTAMDIADTGAAFKEGRIDEGIVGAGAILVAGFTAKSGMDAYNKGKKALGEGAEVAGKKIEKMIKAVTEYLGEGAKGRKNKAGDLIIQSKDEMKQLRIDKNKTFPHGDKPHGHVEEVTEIKDGKKTWDKSGPIYFKEDK